MECLAWVGEDGASQILWVGAEASGVKAGRLLWTGQGAAHVPLWGGEAGRGRREGGAGTQGRRGSGGGGQGRHQAGAAGAGGRGPRAERGALSGL